MFFLRFRIPDVTERHPREVIGRTLANNLVYTIWAVWGGFILHFLLSSYLTVLLRPSYEEPVETAADLIKRDITPFNPPGGHILKQFFAASPDPDLQEISKRLAVAKDFDEFFKMVELTNSTGLYAYLLSQPIVGCLKPTWCMKEKDWYKSSEAIAGMNPYGVHLTNKKWPLKKVFKNKHCKVLVSCSDSFNLI